MSVKGSGVEETGEIPAVAVNPGSGVIVTTMGSEFVITK